MDESSNVVLKSQLQDVTPEIWRRFEIPVECTLHDLHEVMQVLFGWADYHMYQFLIDERRYEKIYPDVDQRDPYDAEEYSLGDLLDEGDQFEYNYDFGDSWRIDMEVRAVRDNPDSKQLRCLDGERAGPPEDSGGPPGYDDFLQVNQDSDHEDHERMKEWIDVNFQIPFGRSRSWTGE
jgi:hypothetical protein